MQPMDIYIADVPFDEENGSKVRPALVLRVRDGWVNVFKVTSQYQNKSAKIKRLYYPIYEWKQAGLKKQSYVDTHRTYSLPEKFIFSRKPIGKLTELDRIKLFEFIQSVRKNK
ncbi:type II toxin-antitoxin system PemK/MazF family toxin [Limosilactobacillus vaginalis]|uniref:Type II toxin-antitoxin system PemK/MazF family toxin n=2 Tax=Lactobacillaceae TaxID=33958 RepID=A0ABT4K808_9LACO|nr:type II toxin-antitoxin system PemK/MazF family toxin [Limosilactobacillus vaginalis]MCZ3753667.1 type II toxin-antitoxin system PemK/MazF family toxin [Limosilactobacillus vaginalis]MCZ3755406.1 type II toxin-antitoxin system PemK/MazF family toxin [Limosilactobacillus vaginalis]MCZ3758805.1 type II toxin-antitoxin system PemK/MazF family toxin [Limosilactobacillus vaginalis]MCZ3764067.1 type II toxin-antitoxin system PemK/MazF family toxin [Limosilactobacillus vaginalis]MCZ3769394.1 type 